MKECPKFDYNQIKYNSTGALNRPVAEGEDLEYSMNVIKTSSPMNFEFFDANHAGKSSTHSINMKDSEIFGYDSGFSNYYCSKDNWEAYLSRNHVDCFPNNELANFEYKKRIFRVYDSYFVLGLICSPLHPKPALYFYRISSKINHRVIGDIMDAKGLILYTALIAILLVLFFLALT